MSELTQYVLTHQQFLYGVIGGFALGHLDDLVAYLFHALMMVPMVRSWITAHPEKTKAIVDQIAKDLDQDIDKETKEPPKAA